MDIDADDERRLVISNLVEHCDEDSVRNYLENPRNFGDGINVENVEIQDGEATVTFRRRNDVDQVLQRHNGEPCILFKRELTLRRVGTCEDSTESTDERYRSLSHIYARTSQYGSSSLRSVSDVNSSELFGSGRGKNDCCSEEIKYIELFYDTPSLQEAQKCEICITETDIVPAFFSYCATTCTSTTHKDTQAEHSLIASALIKILNGSIDINVQKDTIKLTLTADVDQINDITDLKECVLKSVKGLEEVVGIQLLELDRERVDLGVKHFCHVLKKNPSIKIYKNDEEFLLYIVFLKGTDTALVNAHAKIVKNQVIETETKSITATDYVKLEAYRENIDSKPAFVTKEKHLVRIYGLQEDVKSTLYHINKILKTSHIGVKRLEGFAIPLLKNVDISLHKVFWEVSDNFVNVVGKGKEEVDKAIEIFAKLFCSRKIEIPSYVIESSLWEKTKTIAILNSKGKLIIEDNSEQSVVIVKGVSEDCERFIEIANDMKGKCTRSTEKTPLTEEKCRFVMEHLKDDKETTDVEEFLRVYQESDKSVLTAEGTKSAFKRLDASLKEISTQTFWIIEDSAAVTLKTLADDSKMGWKGDVRVLENHLTITIKTGKIEEQKVDAVVNSVGPELKLDAGDNTITKTIYARAGPQCQTSLNHIRTPVQSGFVEVGDRGNLPCKAIIHAVLEQYAAHDKTKSLKNLSDVVFKCLRAASDRGFSSIAFPAICTGVHAYPNKLVAETMYDAISEFCLEVGHSIKEIVFVFLEADKRKMRVFEETKANRLTNMGGMRNNKILWSALPWPCRYYCLITAESSQQTKELAEQINQDLMEQTYQKRTEVTTSR